MILLCGIPSEPPMARVRAALEDMGASCLVLNQRAAAQTAIKLEVADGVVAGELTVGDASWPLDAFRGAYSRITSPLVVPEVARMPADSAERQAALRLHELLGRWLDIAPMVVVNRHRAMASNRSKPFQAQVIRRFGFAVPETLVTGDPERVRAFQARHGAVVYKSISGVRSIVRRLAPGDLSRLARARWCPVQFQQEVKGFDVRVHTVGDAVFATAIESPVVDYRYASRAGTEARLRPWRLSDAVAARCRALASALGLEFAGIDLKIGPDGTVRCFEVNPSPAFSYFEAETGQPIAAAVAGHLVSAGEQ